jgi:predicted metalloprotease with PDZ domain
MDSPAEFGSIVWRRFSVGAQTFRFAAHHTGTEAELDTFVRDVERIVHEERVIYGEFPAYEPGHYTFLADYLPVAEEDAMEHRNSAVLTSIATMAGQRSYLLEGVAHELFHSWNVERIRPRSLEPFDFDRVNVSSDLWLAEGFTQYYGPLVLARAGLVDDARAAGTLSDIVDGISASPARAVRSAEQMSQMAPFVDGGRPMDRTNWSRTVFSYYSHGAAIALALDLTLRDRSDGRVSLDDFMRGLWRSFGKPGGSRPGYVDRPYTSADAEKTLAEVSGDGAFAGDFFSRYIRGREVADYPRLLARAGFVVRKYAAERSWIGDLTFVPGRLKIAELVAPTWPAYQAGLEQDDTLEQLDGQRIQSESDLARVLDRRKPGDRIPIAYTDRYGRAKASLVTLVENPHLEVVPIEATGGRPSEAQQNFRTRWLGKRR